MPSHRTSRHGLHGNVADQSRVAVLLVDVINSFDYPGGEELVAPATEAAREIRKMKREAARRGFPVIYANDNFGRWRSNLDRLVEYCRKGKGRRMVELLKPAPKDYFVLKAKNSAFYSTCLDLLLQSMGVRTIVLAGFTSDNCVLFTGNDAYLRDYRLVVPEDCVASFDTEKTAAALAQMRRILKADTGPWKQGRYFRGRSKSRS